MDVSRTAVWPDQDTVTDLLGFDHLVQVLAELVTEPGLLPATIGVFGDWGSGKSSLLRMAQDLLRQHDDVLVVSFNGWLFEGYDDAKAALMETILEAIAEDRTPTNKAKALAASLLKRVNWLRVGTLAAKAAAGAFVGPAGVSALMALDLAAAGKRAAQAVAASDAEDLEALQQEPVQDGHRGIREFRSDFKDLLDETQLRSLVVIIDDLDRCLEDTIISTLEAIKLFLFVPGSAFVLGADERLIRHAVRRRFPEIPGTERTEVGRDYLEKLIQYPLYVPPMSDTEITSYLCLLFLQAAGLEPDQFQACCAWAMDPQHLHAGQSFTIQAAQELCHELPPELLERLALGERIAPLLATGLNGNPRQVKRFLNTLMMRLRMAHLRDVELQQRALAKLMLLEYLRPETFRRLAELQGEQKGRPSQLAMLEDQVGIDDRTTTDATPGAAVVDAQAESQADAQPASRASSRTPRRAEQVEQRLAPLDEEVATWAADPWIQEWVAIEPPLQDVDLRPYFYFARREFAPMAGSTKRLSPLAQEVLGNLLETSEGAQTRGVQQAGGLAPADASAIFEELAQRVRQAEDLTREGNPLRPLLKFVAARQELAGELVSLLRGLPEEAVPIWSATRLWGLCEGLPARALAMDLLQRWAASVTNPNLAQASKDTLARA